MVSTYIYIDKWENHAWIDLVTPFSWSIVTKCHKAGVQLLKINKDILGLMALETVF